MKKNQMEKYIKFTLITLFLISSFKYSNTAACNAASITKADCTANTTCEWTATPCKGSDACKTAANHAAQATCVAALTGCTHATPQDGTPTCKTSAGVDCANGFTNADTCQKCQWDADLGTCAEKSQNSDIANCATVDTSDSTKCKTCNSGYTLSSDAKSCNKNTEDPANGNFGSCLKFSGLIALLSLLF